MIDQMKKIGFGGAVLAGEAGGYCLGKAECSAQDLLSYAYERGIRYYDCAPIYGFEQAEKELGVFSKSRREKIRLSSKSGVSWHDNRRVNMSNDPDLTLKMLENSLRNFQTDYIDEYYVHWPDSKVDIRYPLEVLQKAKDEGKIISIGLGNTNEEDLEKAKEVTQVRCVQSEYNLFSNAFEDMSLNGIQKVGWGSLDKGILAESVDEKRVFSKEDARSWAFWWKKSNWKEKVEKVKMIKSQFNIDLLSYALHYTFNYCDISLVGVKSFKHIDHVITAMNTSIDEDVLKTICHEIRS